MKLSPSFGFALLYHYWEIQNWKIDIMSVFNVLLPIFLSQRRFGTLLPHNWINTGAINHDTINMRKNLGRKEEYCGQPLLPQAFPAKSYYKVNRHYLPCVTRIENRFALKHIRVPLSLFNKAGSKHACPVICSRLNIPECC